MNPPDILRMILQALQPGLPQPMQGAQGMTGGFGPGELLQAILGQLGGPAGNAQGPIGAMMGGLPYPSQQLPQLDMMRFLPMILGGAR